MSFCPDKRQFICSTWHLHRRAACDKIPLFDINTIFLIARFDTPSYDIVAEIVSEKAKNFLPYILFERTSSLSLTMQR